MRVLLDTHAWLWMLTEPERLGDALAIVEDARNELLLSAASSWEIAIKYTLGRLPLPEPPAAYVPARIASTGVTPLAVEHSHALAVAELPDHHRDPFDRILVAQAVLEAVPIVSGDQALARYEVEVIRPG
ncbi:MAG TPA: type II toxin-antitoxin system VapC family toxin [Acidimicrobiia bacterium]